jgi:hypothetical protein
MRFVQARRMATLHPQARIECIKTLLIAGRSRSEIGARLGLRRSVVCALVHRLKRDGVALPRSRPGPKPVIIGGRIALWRSPRLSPGKKWRHRISVRS